MHHFKMTYTVRQKLSTRDFSTILLTAGLLTVYFLPTDFLFHNPTSFCIHKNILHVDCPGCGMTRALNCLLHGQFTQAIMFNISVIPFSILLTQHYLSYLIPLKLNETTRRIAYWGFAITLLTNYIFKIISFTLTSINQ